MDEWVRFWKGLLYGVVFSVIILVLLVLAVSSVRGEAFAFQMPSNNSFLVNRSSFRFDSLHPIPENMSPSYFYLEAVFVDENNSPYAFRQVNVSLVSGGVSNFTILDGSHRVFYDNSLVSNFSGSSFTDGDGYFFMVVPDLGTYYVSLDAPDVVYGFELNPYIYFDTAGGSGWRVSPSQVLYDAKDLVSVLFDGFVKVIVAVGGFAVLFVFGLVFVGIVALLRFFFK